MPHKRARTAATKRKIKRDRAFVENLRYLLEWPLTADDIARHLGLADSATVEKRFHRMNMVETDVAERYRRRKPGYCIECRLTDEAHRNGCSEFIATDDALRRRREIRVREMQDA